LKKHSEFKSYTTSSFTYSSLRIFYRKHPQSDKLPTTPAPLPLLVFIHGLGGSVAQFHPLLTSLVNLSSCLAIDLPGCGLSTFNPSSWDAYKTEALAELLATVIEDYRDKAAGQNVVLIGHSMGCSLAALIASRVSAPSKVLADHVVGLVAICPQASPPNEKQVAKFRKLLMIPGPIFDVWRSWDRRGGPESVSVKRFVGADADLETRKLQVRFNEQSRTPVWRRMASGSLPVYKKGIAHGGLPGKEVWAGLEVPVFLVAGESDNITKPGEIVKISEFLGKSHPVRMSVDQDSETTNDSSAPADTSSFNPSSNSRRTVDTLRDEDFAEKKTSETAESLREDPSTPQEELADIPPQSNHPKKVLKTTILPAPANHALVYMPATVRTLAGLISDFLCSQVSPRLSLGWQLQFLSTAGKWDVKNLAKWQAVKPVSEPIAGVFRAMKTLREVDESHCPEVFVKQWGNQVKDIIDISHESPVYDPRGLEKGGTHYHKLPTVSKIPPTTGEVKEFIILVDRLREEQKIRAVDENWDDGFYIGVHCHYGFNRTGFFIVCYLIERCGYSVQMALDEFAVKRPKGIKHAHFTDQLFVRYCVGLKRAPTL
jgi:pimeloyl-ACP methyl ester carboxylesterase/protein-tyrosine phosphatase